MLRPAENTQKRFKVLQTLWKAAEVRVSRCIKNSGRAVVVSGVNGGARGAKAKKCV